jgi:hypothetical protein
MGAVPAHILFLLDLLFVADGLVPLLVPETRYMCTQHALLLYC